MDNREPMTFGPIKKTGGILRSSSWMIASPLSLSVESLSYTVNITDKRGLNTLSENSISDLWR